MKPSTNAEAGGPKPADALRLAEVVLAALVPAAGRAQDATLEDSRESFPRSGRRELGGGRMLPF